MKIGHIMFCCSMTLQDRKTLNKQHRNLHPLDIQFYHSQNILQIWPHRTIFCSTKWKNHFAEENSLPVMTWREMSVTLCALFIKTGRLPLFEINQKYGKVAQTTSKVLQCDLSPDISWMLVTQMNVKLFMNSPHMVYYQPIIWRNAITARDVEWVAQKGGKKWTLIQKLNLLAPTIKLVI